MLIDYFLFSRYDTFCAAKVGIILRFLQEYFYKKHFCCTNNLIVCIKRGKMLSFCASALQILFVTVGTFTLQVVKNDFADAHALGGHLHVFVGFDIFKCFFQRELDRRNDVSLLVGTARAYIS